MAIEGVGSHMPSAAEESDAKALVYSSATRRHSESSALTERGSSSPVVLLLQHRQSSAVAPCRRREASSLHSAHTTKGRSVAIRGGGGTNESHNAHEGATAASLEAILSAVFGRMPLSAQPTKLVGEASTLLHAFWYVRNFTVRGRHL
eukprot:749943-Prymnesium_polylepis.2